ncbi:MAG TPA: hypothetical protein VMB50_04790 [Myxococcales bacterium]|nr:hypothetical protein [Myxococcales bacterium]
MAFKLPERYQLAWRSLANLDALRLRRLGQAIEDAQPHLYAEDLARKAAQRSRVELPVVRPIIDLLTSLSSARARQSQSLGTLLKDLRDDARRRGGDFVPKTSWGSFTAFLKRVLEAEAIVITAKAQTVMVAHQHVFLSARVLTDLRPVFGNDELGRLRAGVVVHTLQLDHLDGGGKRSFFIALDDEDVSKLRAALDRASEKSQLIENGMKGRRFLLLKRRDTT